jgi:hypothetical protein
MSRSWIPSLPGGIQDGVARSGPFSKSLAL